MPSLLSDTGQSHFQNQVQCRIADGCWCGLRGLTVSREGHAFRFHRNARVNGKKLGTST